MTDSAGIRVGQTNTQYSICFCGDIAIGKTTLVNAALKLRTDDISHPTVLADRFTYKVQLESGRTKEIIFWDLSGNENFRNCTPQYFRQSRLTVIVFDLTRTPTFDNVEAWANLVSNSVGDCEVPFILVGNKCDLESERAVQTSEGEALGQRLNALAYIETSATQNIQVEDLCALIEAQAKEFFKNLKEPVIEPRPNDRETGGESDPKCKC